MNPPLPPRPSRPISKPCSEGKTFICLALSSGIPPQVVMKWTGHCDYMSMKPYIDITEST